MTELYYNSVAFKYEKGDTYILSRKVKYVPTKSGRYKRYGSWSDGEYFKQFTYEDVIPTVKIFSTRRGETEINVSFYSVTPLSDEIILRYSKVALQEYLDKEIVKLNQIKRLYDTKIKQRP